MRKAFAEDGMITNRDEQDDADADAVLQHRKHRHVGGVVRLELAGLAVKHRSNPLDDAFAEQALRPEQQEDSAIT